MAIDFHAHLARNGEGVPPFMRHLFDVEGYLEKQESAGLEHTVLSYVLSDDEGSRTTLDDAKRQHEFLADLVERNSGRLSAFAGIDALGEEAWLAEAENALDVGFAGLSFPTSRGGRYLDAPEAQDALAIANERGAVVFLHPSQSPVPVDRIGHGMLQAWIGYPFDTAICLSRMILAGTLSRYPRVRLIAAHCGGVLPMLLGRLDFAYEGMARVAALRAKGASPGGPGGGGGAPPGPGATKKGAPTGPPASAESEGAIELSLSDAVPSERAAGLFFDTASYHPAAIRAAIEAAGIDRVVLGTDYPPAGDSPGGAIEAVERLGLNPEDRDKILRHNASQLLAGSPEPAN